MWQMLALLLSGIAIVFGSFLGGFYLCHMYWYKVEHADAVRYKNQLEQLRDEYKRLETLKNVSETQVLEYVEETREASTRFTSLMSEIDGVRSLQNRGPYFLGLLSLLIVILVGLSLAYSARVNSEVVRLQVASSQRAATPRIQPKQVTPLADSSSSPQIADDQEIPNG